MAANEKGHEASDLVTLDNTAHRNHNARPKALELRPEGIPDELKNEPRWMLWRHTWHKGRWVKMPCQVDGKPIDATDARTWATFGEVLTAHALGGFAGPKFDGLGFALGDGFHGIDVDDCIAADGQMNDLAREVLGFEGYVETSPSGTGIKLFTRSNLERARKDNAIGLETYPGGRYFTVTGHQVNGHDRLPVVPVDLASFVQRRFNEAIVTREPSTAEFLIPSGPLIISTEHIRQVLDTLLRGNALDGYDDWLGVGMALHHQFSSDVEGLDLWDEYSSQAAGYTRREALEYKWRGFKWSGGNLTFASCIYKARMLDPSLKGLPATDFPFVHCRDLLHAPTSPRWLVRDWIEAGSLSLLFGESTAGKSFLALDWCCCIALGTPWNGRAVQQGPVFYIAGEGKAGLGRRIAAWGQAHGKDMAQAPLFVSDRGAAFMDATEAKSVADAVKALSADHGTPALVVIDTMHRNFGQGDENSAADVAVFLSNIDRTMRLALGCTVLVIHHSGHSNKDRSRGSGAIRAALDSEFQLALTGAQRVLTCMKEKDAEKPDPIAFTDEVVTLPWVDESGFPLTSLVLHPTGGPAPVAQKPLTGAKLIARDALARLAAGPGEVTEEAWRAECYRSGISTGDDEAKRKAFSRASVALVSEGHIAARDGIFWVNP